MYVHGKGLRQSLTYLIVGELASRWRHTVPLSRSTCLVVECSNCSALYHL